jgi:hypothetical protein
MAKNNVRKKPTSKEMASAIIEINNKTNELYKVVKQIDSILGLYVEMKGDKEKFGAYVDKKYEEYNAQAEAENDTEKDGESDKENIQADSKDEGSGAKGVRKETK